MNYLLAILILVLLGLSVQAETSYKNTDNPVDYRNKLEELWVQKNFDGLRNKLGREGDPWEGTLAQLYHRVRLLQRDGSQYEEAVNGLKTIRRAIYRDIQSVNPAFLSVLNHRLKRLEKSLSWAQKKGWTAEERKKAILLAKQWKPNKPWDDGTWAILIPDMYLDDKSNLIPIKRPEPSLDNFTDINFAEAEKMLMSPDGSSESRYAASHWLSDHFLSKDFDYLVKGLRKNYAGLLFPLLREKFWDKHGNSGLVLFQQALMSDEFFPNSSVSKFFLFALAGAPEGQRDKARQMINEMLTHEKRMELREYGARLSNAMSLPESKARKRNALPVSLRESSIEKKELPQAQEKNIADHNKAKKYGILVMVALLVVGGYLLMRSKNKA